MSEGATCASMRIRPLTPRQRAHIEEQRCAMRSSMSFSLANRNHAKTRRHRQRQTQSSQCPSTELMTCMHSAPRLYPGTSNPFSGSR
jgi:hypothetical protein